MRFAYCAYTIILFPYSLEMANITLGHKTKTNMSKTNKPIMFLPQAGSRKVDIKMFYIAICSELSLIWNLK